MPKKKKSPDNKKLPTILEGPAENKLSPILELKHSNSTPSPHIYNVMDDDTISSMPSGYVPVHVDELRTSSRNCFIDYDLINKIAHGYKNKQLHLMQQQNNLTNQIFNDLIQAIGGKGKKAGNYKKSQKKKKKSQKKKKKKMKKKSQKKKKMKKNVASRKNIKKVKISYKR